LFLEIKGGREMEIKFDSEREEEIFREFLKDVDISNMRPELVAECDELLIKMKNYFGVKK
jgi:hypothetical protein